jgi:exosome complex component RRP4
MGKLLVKEKDIVVPGEDLAEGMDYLPVSGAYREEDKIIANHIGVVSINGRLVKVIPLRGKYTPKVGDVVIAKVVDMSFSNWYLDIGCPQNAMLSVRDATEFVEKGADLNQFYSFGDIIVARISKVMRGTVELTMRAPGLRKLGVGRLLPVGSSKVPRIIGKQGSMISVIKEKTGCRVIVGQNGLAWIQGDPKNEMVAVQALELVNTNSHKEGLTDEVTKFLAKHMKGLTVSPDHYKDDDQLYQEHQPQERRDHRGGYRDNRGGGYRDNRRGGYRDNRGGGYRDNHRNYDRPSSDRGRDSSSHDRREMRDARKRGGYI